MSAVSEKQFPKAFLGLRDAVAKKPAARTKPYPLLGGSWVVISGVISRVSVLITHIGGHNL